MKNLQLSLKTKWFEMTKAGIKTEDYREITPYWCNRLAKLNGQKMNKEKWRRYLIASGSYYMSLCTHPEQEINQITLNGFNENIMTLGYPKSGDTERILKLKHKGIEIRTGNPEWGAEEGKLYFVIKHGEIIK